MLDRFYGHRNFINSMKLAADEFCRRTTVVVTQYGDFFCSPFLSFFSPSLISRMTSCILGANISFILVIEHDREAAEIVGAGPMTVGPI